MGANIPQTVDKNELSEGKTDDRKIKKDALPPRFPYATRGTTRKNIAEQRACRRKSVPLHADGVSPDKVGERRKYRMRYNTGYNYEGLYDHYVVDADAPLLDYLLTHVKESKNKIKATLKGRGIRVDGKCVTQYDYPLTAGMKVSVSKTKRNQQGFRNRYVRIVYEDRWLIVVEKAAGILSMAAGHSSLNVKSVLDDYFVRSRQRCRAHVVHRLDRDTSGLMVYAKDMETEQAFEHDWHDIVYDRRYVAVVSGEVKDDGGTVASWLKDNKAYITYSSDTDNGGKYAVTHYHVLARTTDRSLVEYRLETGRKNQIRVHSADIGHPVCGDNKYGNGDDPIGRLCLHAFLLCFEHPATHERMEFETPVPPAFRKLFK